MRLPLSAADEAALIAAAIAALFLLTLILRNPFKPCWLDHEGIASGIALLLTTALSVAFSTLMSEFIAAEIGFTHAVMLGLGWGILVFVALWLLVGMSARLRVCAEGRSPFRVRLHLALMECFSVSGSLAKWHPGRIAPYFPYSDGRRHMADGCDRTLRTH